ncbi:MAG TPA: hypothetical protein VGE74_07245 [Gemmata sp.]
MTIKLLRIVVCVVALAAVGCSKPVAKVRGKITVDGKNVERGTVEFVLESGEGATVGAVINPDSTYQLETVPGQMVVRINAGVVTGKVPIVPGPGEVEVVKNVTPDRYNTKSVLRADLKPGENECNFELHGK